MVEPIEPVAAGYNKRAKEEELKKNLPAIYDQARIAKNASLGTSGIDPADVMPSEVALVQGSSNFARVVAEDGTQAKVGQFFFRGDKSIHETVVGYALSLSKVNDTFNQNEDGSYQKMYRMIGVFEDLKTPFTMNFRRAAIATIKAFLSNVFSQKRGIYTFKIEISYEQRQAVIDGKQVNYLVPIVTIKEKLADAKLLAMLEGGVLKYDYLVRLTVEEVLPVVRKPTVEIVTSEVPVDETKKLDENVNPDDIPF